MDCLGSEHVSPQQRRFNSESCVLYALTSPTIETVFSMGSVQSAYKRSEFASQLSSGQLQVVVRSEIGKVGVEKRIGTSAVQFRAVNCEYRGA
jgi:hypothetical protein